MGGCDITTNPTPNFKAFEQWHPSHDISLKLLKNTSIWQKFNNTLQYELTRIEAFQKPVEWHITQLSKCLEYFSSELTNGVKEREKEESEKLYKVFFSRIKYLQKNERIFDYLIQKGFKITNFGFKLEEVNLNNIWAELFPIGYYFRFEEEDQPFNDDTCLKLLSSSIDLSNGVKEKLKMILEKNIPLNQITRPLYNLLVEYYSLPLVDILKRSVLLYNIHDACSTLLTSSSAPSTPLHSNSSSALHSSNNINNHNNINNIKNINNINNGPINSNCSLESSEKSQMSSNHVHMNGDSHNFSSSLNLHCDNNNNINLISINGGRTNQSVYSDDSNEDEEDITDDSDNVSEIDEISHTDSENNNNNISFYLFNENQIELINELKQHSLNKSSYLLQIKRSIRMEHKRNFNLPGERCKKQSKNQSDINPHLSLLCLTNNLHIGESIDSLDPGNRCIYRKCYHLYKNSIEADLLLHLNHSYNHNHNHIESIIEKAIYHSTPPSPSPISPSSSSLSLNGNHLSLSTSSPSNVISPSPLSSSIYSSTEPFKHIPFFIWLEGKDLDGVKMENFYHWDLIPSLSMKVSFHNGFAYHPLCSLSSLQNVNNNKNINNDDNINNNKKEELYKEGKIIDGVYIYAIDENDDLYVLPKVPEDEKERKELDLTSLNLLTNLYPHYLLFPNHPRLIHSANGRSLGEITFINGKITKISNVSGHYRPHGYQFYLAVIELCKNGEIFNDDAIVMYRHSTGTDYFAHSQFIKLNRKEMLMDVIRGKDRATGLLYHVKCNCD